MSTSASRIARQSETIETASAWGEPWTPDEVQFVREHTDIESDADIAFVLDRTLYAVENLQHRLHNGGVDLDASRATRGEQVRPLSNRTYDFVTTFPEGWND